MKIVMVAAENGAVPGGKVGGMGDVIRDIPKALAELGHQVDLIMPGYQAFSLLPGAAKFATIPVPFRHQVLNVDIYSLSLPNDGQNLRCWVVDHPLLAPLGKGKIYCEDLPGRPFATDATKFAFFSAAAAALISNKSLGDFDVIHLHDWHTALVAVLAKFDPRYAQLANKTMVFTIHNLALQGIRPFANDDSSLESWFPHLRYDRAPLIDPRYSDCINPMRAAINLCDKVHAVSPTYANEIQRPSRPSEGFFGGEGLEKDLQSASRDGRLAGILNGCEYPVQQVPASSSYRKFLDFLHNQLDQWIAEDTQVATCHYFAARRLSELKLKRKSPDMLITSVGRLTLQKALLFEVVMSNGQSCLENLLDKLAPSDLFIMLGSGDHQLEDSITKVAARRKNFLFLKGYSEVISEELYARGDLFLMPSSFEPCGISQMLAMRAGQPCLVHGVGGLLDTVSDGSDGFVFGGDNILEQAEAFVTTFSSVLALSKSGIESNQKHWHAISAAAAQKRFYWRDAALKYSSELYSVSSKG